MLSPKIEYIYSSIDSSMELYKTKSEEIIARIKKMRDDWRNSDEYKKQQEDMKKENEETNMKFLLAMRNTKIDCGKLNEDEYRKVFMDEFNKLDSSGGAWKFNLAEYMVPYYNSLPHHDEVSLQYVDGRQIVLPKK